MLKELFTLAHVLTFPKGGIGFTIHCNASKVDFCDFMMQESMETAYSSRKFKPHNKNYPTYDLEATVISLLMMLKIIRVEYTMRFFPMILTLDNSSISQILT